MATVSSAESTAPVLSTPVAISEDTIASFWRNIAYLTTRTRTAEGRWIGSQEVKVWNSNNTDSCSKCQHGRTLKYCIIEEDQASCRACREAKISCDRKTKFLFDSTCVDFFPDINMFMQVYSNRNQQQVRTYQKTANKRRKASLPPSSCVSTSRIVPAVQSAIFLHPSPEHEKLTREEITALRQKIQAQDLEAAQNRSTIEEMRVEIIALRGKVQELEAKLEVKVEQNLDQCA